MARKICEEQMKDIIWGATLMGGGGGGSIASGIQLMNACRPKPDAEVPPVEMIDVTDMGDELASATAGMGAPAAIVGLDFSQYALNASLLLSKIISSTTDWELKYTFPVELGGFSIFFPFLLSIKSNGSIPVVDADGSGRAVPALETLLLNVNGCPTTPMALANDKVNVTTGEPSGDLIPVLLADPYDAPLAEKIGRDICGLFGNMVGISGWPVTREQLEQNVCIRTITLCEQIGHLFRSAGKADETLFKQIPGISGLVLPTETKEVCTGVITEIKTETRSGFDYGTLTVQDEKDPSTKYRITFQNENLLLEKVTGETTQPMMTVPDITSIYCLDPAGAKGVEVNMPLSNADAKEGMRVAVGVIGVDRQWFKNKDAMKWWTVWNECMENIGYEGGYLPFENV